MEGKFRFSIDRGGTFTDIYAEVPTEKGFRVMKLLSVDPANYKDAPTEGIRRILESVTGIPHPKDQPVDTSRIEWIRMGTTVATNALLERKGERCALVITKGFRDLLHIGNQSRPRIFDLEIKRPQLLYEQVIEVDERVRLISSQAAQLSPYVEEELRFLNSELENQQSQEEKSRGPYEKVVKGVIGETVAVLDSPDLAALRVKLQSVLDSGITSLAVLLMHSYTFMDHERAIGQLATSMGFQQVSLSSELMPMVKMVPRGYTACADAYLTPCIRRYLSTFESGFDAKLHENARVNFMQSDGGLSSVDKFYGFRAILSGPAGGVVGYSRTTFDEQSRQPVIGFDMGGTSTDVSRFAGEFEHVFESTTAGVTIMAPQLDINTVAAGGGSMLFFRSGMFVVGPDSASAHPGPACYKKGGPLTITDANLRLGRLLPEFFPKIFGPSQSEPLDAEVTRTKFDELTSQINTFFREQKDGKEMTAEEVAYGFISVANETMCRPIRALTQAKGYDITQHILSVFGGAGGQHACAIARSLGIRTIFIHRFAGILSAYGLGLADVVQEVQEPAQVPYSPENLPLLQEKLAALGVEAIAKLKQQGFSDDTIVVQPYLNLRYDGTDTAIMSSPDPQDGHDYASNFTRRYQQEYGFKLNRRIVVDDIRVRAIGRNGAVNQLTVPASLAPPQASCLTNCYFEGGSMETPVYLLENLGAGTRLEGPAIIIDSTSTVLIEPACVANITEHGNIRIDVASKSHLRLDEECDPIQLSIFSHRFMSIAEQMGRTLQRTAISTNIKERLDFSCALFGPNGDLVANAPHLPVHLGAMQEAVRFQIQHLGDNWKPGDVIVSNHPQAGGSHLPDITVMTAVFWPGNPRPVFYVASRGHHADIGGIFPGSMPPFSKSLLEEGAAILSFKLVSEGHFDEAGITELLNAPGKVDLGPDQPKSSGTRNLNDNLSDLKAQVAANQKGISLMEELIAEYSLGVVQAYMTHIQANAEVAVRDMLRDIAEKNNLPDIGTLEAVDYLDDGTPIALHITINKRDGSAVFDFSGTGSQVLGNLNAPRAVTYSAIIYCLRCLVQRDIPLNQGCLKPIEITIPKNSILWPSADAAVVGGNVLTSQRVTDVILKAFGACAASQGCMNNFTCGNERFGYYETIAGGAGAGPHWVGQSGVHTHMTNTRITDPEILERRYPIILREFSLRPGSGGEGQFRGGDGVVREMEFMAPLSVGILSERRAFRPYGMAGGGAGAPGLNTVIRAGDDIKINLGPKNTYQAQRGDRVRILTPGGGAWGAARSPSVESGQSSVVSRVEESLGSVHQYRLLQEQA